MTDTPGWDLDELVRRAVLALSPSSPAGGSGGGSGGGGVPLAAPGARSRVRGLPDRRAVRWYTTTGLVDRPVGGRGRGARYGPQHLAQLVAIKRLQAAGHSLAEVQARLLGADDATLLAVADLPPQALGVLPEVPPEVPREALPEASPVGRIDRFWAPPGMPPVELTSGHAVSGFGPAARATPDHAAPDPSVSPPAVRPTSAAVLSLSGGALLVLPRSPSPAELSTLTEAATPLVHALAALGLTDPVPTAPVPAATPGGPR